MKLNDRRSRREATTSAPVFLSVFAVVVVIAVTITYLAFSGSLLATGTTSRETISYSQGTGSSSSCSPTGGKGFYVRLVAEKTGEPIQNVTVGGSPGLTCNGIETTTAIIWQAPTNSSGVASLNSAGSSWYVLTIQYSGNAYHFRVEMHQNQTTYVTVRLPSGNITTSFV